MPGDQASPSGAHRPTRRTIAKLIKLTLLGALTTPAVAWIGACLPTMGMTIVLQNFQQIDGEQYMAAQFRYGLCMTWIVWQHWPVESRFIKITVGDPFRPPSRWSSIWSPERRLAAQAADRTAVGEVTSDIASGWPFRSTVGTMRLGWYPESFDWRRNGSVFTGPMWIRRDATGARIGAPRLIPLKPLWPGFVADTIFYGVVWWVFLLALAAWTRRRRRRAGRCVHCRYDLRATPPNLPCPECGRDVASR